MPPTLFLTKLKLIHRFLTFINNWNVDNFLSLFYSALQKVGIVEKRRNLFITMQKKLAAILEFFLLLQKFINI